MTIAEVLLTDLPAITGNARRIIERLPGDRAAWTPHEKSMKLGALAMHCALMPAFGSDILTTDVLDMSKAKRPDHGFHSVEDALAKLDAGAGTLREQLSSLSDHELESEWIFSFGERTIFKGPRITAYRAMFANHLIHHTAQLGVYLRLLGVAVPGLFGPSADEPWQG